MHHFIKPKSISENNLNSYISIIGIASCKVFSLLFEEDLKNFNDFLKKYNIQKFELESYLNMLQAAKLIQISVVKENLHYQMFKPLMLEGDENKKWILIQNHEVNVDSGSNISKTYFDVFNKSFVPKEIQFEKKDSWVMYFEKMKTSKINIAELIFINQVQSDQKLINKLVNYAIARTFKKCQKWNPKYFELVAKTFSKIGINSSQQADNFFSGKFFAKPSENIDYLYALEKELEILEKDNG